MSTAHTAAPGRGTDPDTVVSVVVNGAAAPRDAPLAGPLTAEGFAAARAEIAAWPGYAPTPLVRLPALAAALGLGEILYKDEAGRFGLGSFKPLGAAYAAARAIARELERRGVAGSVSPADVREGRHATAAREVTLLSATDGNHGRALAWGARLFGARARIFAHERMSEGRRRAIRDLGAELVICPGGYDDSVREAFASGARGEGIVVQDTSVGDYRAIPADISHGYGVIAGETVDALAEPPSHAIVQAGVGGVASAVAARFWLEWGPRRPRFIVLEPVNAACVAASLAAGLRTSVGGDTHTAMAGLACGEVSEIAWEVLAAAADAAIVVGDGWAFRGMRRLADPVAGDPAIVAGECAGGAIGALMALADRPELRAALGLDGASRVFVLGTEGATDPAIYESVTGRRAEEVAA